MVKYPTTIKYKGKTYKRSATPTTIKKVSQKRRISSVPTYKKK